jgi:hypothetical protein
VRDLIAIGRPAIESDGCRTFRLRQGLLMLRLQRMNRGDSFVI